MDKLLTNNSFRRVIAVVTVAVSLAQGLTCIFVAEYYKAFVMLMNMLCVVCLMICLKKRDGNTMKRVLGAIWMLFVMKFAFQFFAQLSYPKVNFMRLMILAVTPIVICIMMISHMFINENKNSNSKAVLFNKVCTGFLFLYQIVLMVYNLKMADTGMMVFSYVIAFLSFMTTLIFILCIEAKRDEAYRGK